MAFVSRPAVERAARLADGILCVLPDQIGVYVDSRRALGRDDGQVALGYQWVVADDPERAFAAVAPHILYQVNAYAEFGMFGDVAPLTDAQQLIDLGFYRLYDADGATAELLRLIASGPVVDCFSWTLVPGEPLERASERLEYVATRVIPAVRAASAPAGGRASRSPGS